MRPISISILAAALLAVVSTAAGSPQAPPKKDIKDTKRPEPKKLDPDSAAGQSRRWVLRMKSRGGKDYIEQLAAMRVAILVPVPPDNKKTWFVADLRKPAAGRAGTDQDLKQLTAQFRLTDQSDDAIKAVTQTLGLKYTPKVFYAFFPQDIRQELARLEKEHQKLDTKDIERTVFTVTVKDGKPAFAVAEQLPEKEDKE